MSGSTEAEENCQKPLTHWALCLKSARQTEGEALWDKPKTKMPERADRSRAMA